jgi:hypothetical protein
MKKREIEIVNQIVDLLKNHDLYEKLFEKIECHLKKHPKKKP